MSSQVLTFLWFCIVARWMHVKLMLVIDCCVGQIIMLFPLTNRKRPVLSCDNTGWNKGRVRNGKMMRKWEDLFWSLHKVVVIENNVPSTNDKYSLLTFIWYKHPQLHSSFLQRETPSIFAPYQGQQDIHVIPGGIADDIFCYCRLKSDLILFFDLRHVDLSPGHDRPGECLLVCSKS